MVERRMVTKHLGPVVLSAADDHGVRGGVLADELKLRDGNAFVDAIVPCRAAIGGLVDAAVVAGVNGQMIGRMAGEGMIVGVDAASNVRHRPHTPSPDGLVHLNPGEIDDVRCGNIDEHVQRERTVHLDHSAGY